MDDHMSKAIQSAELRRVIQLGAPPTELPSQPAPCESRNDCVFDREAALERVVGDEEFLAEVVKLFLGVTPSQIGEIQNAIAHADAKRVQHVAHSLKGAASCLGAGPASAAALLLEQVGKSGDLARARELFAELEREFKRLIDALSEHFLQVSM